MYRGWLKKARGGGREYVLQQDDGAVSMERALRKEKGRQFKCSAKGSRALAERIKRTSTYRGHFLLSAVSIEQSSRG